MHLVCSEPPTSLRTYLAQFTFVRRVEVFGQVLSKSLCRNTTDKYFPLPRKNDLQIDLDFPFNVEINVLIADCQLLTIYDRLCLG